LDAARRGRATLTALAAGATAKADITLATSAAGAAHVTLAAVATNPTGTPGARRAHRR